MQIAFSRALVCELTMKKVNIRTLVSSKDIDLSFGAMEISASARFLRMRV
jgi:hypothetical protein